jgi:RNA polymerase sigma-70 factor (ECF subfamily)
MFELYEQCRAAEFGFARAEFRAFLEEIARKALGEAATDNERIQLLSTLHLNDLVLARACARGHERAWDEFVTTYRSKLYSISLAITRQAAAARELADSLYADLFGMHAGSDGERRSKLESYHGRGSLEGWLRTVLAQRHIDGVRSQRKLVAISEVTAVDKKQTSPQDDAVEVETHVLRFLDMELAALRPEEKFLLAAYYLDDRTLAQIGFMLNVHESTVARRLHKSVSCLRKRILSRLRHTGLSKRAAEATLDKDVRDLSVDVRKHFAQEGQR